MHREAGFGLERLGYARRRREIHVRDPHGDRVGRIDAGVTLDQIPFGRVRAAPLDHAVEIECRGQGGRTVVHG